MLWLVLDYMADGLYILDVVVRARTGECARPRHFSGHGKNLEQVPGARHVQRFCAE